MQIRREGYEKEKREREKSLPPLNVKRRDRNSPAKLRGQGNRRRTSASSDVMKGGEGGLKIREDSTI